MNKKLISTLTLFLALALVSSPVMAEETETQVLYDIDTQEDWQDAIISSSNINVNEDGELVLNEYDNFDIQTETELHKLVKDWENFDDTNVLENNIGDANTVPLGDVVEDYPEANNDRALITRTLEEGWVKVSQNQVDIDLNDGVEYSTFAYLDPDNEERYKTYNWQEDQTDYYVGFTVRSEHQAGDSQTITATMSHPEMENRLDIPMAEYQEGWYELLFEQTEDGLQFEVRDENRDGVAMFTIDEETGIVSDNTEFNHAEGDFSEARWNNNYNEILLRVGPHSRTDVDTSIENNDMQGDGYEIDSSVDGFVPQTGEVVSVDDINEPINGEVTFNVTEFHESFHPDSDSVGVQDYEIDLAFVHPQSDIYAEEGNDPYHRVTVEEVSSDQETVTVSGETTAFEVWDQFSSTSGSELVIRPYVRNLDEDIGTQLLAESFYLDSPETHVDGFFDQTVLEGSQNIVDTEGHYALNEDISYGEMFSSQGTVVLDPQDLPYGFEPEGQFIETVSAIVEESVDREVRIESAMAFVERHEDITDMTAEEIRTEYILSNQDEEIRPVQSHLTFNVFSSSLNDQGGETVGTVDDGTFDMIDWLEQDYSQYGQYVVVFEIFDEATTDQTNYVYQDSYLHEMELTTPEIETYVVGQDIVGDLSVEGEEYQDYYHSDGSVSYLHGTSFIQKDGEVISQSEWENVGQFEVGSSEVSSNDVGVQPYSFGQEFGETYYTAGEYTFGVMVMRSDSQIKPESLDEESLSLGEWEEYEHQEVTRETFEFAVVEADQPLGVIESLNVFFSSITESIVQTLQDVFSDGEIQLPQLEEPPTVE